MSPSSVLYFIEPLFNRSATKSNLSLNHPARFARRVPDEPKNPETPPRRRQGRRATILAEGAGTVVALEAALALRLDPSCVPALADPAAVRTERTPRRLLGWLRRRRSA